MESVESPEEEGKLNTPVPEPHIIPSYSYSPPLLAHVSNQSAEFSLVSENDVIGSKDGGATEMFLWDE